MKTKFKLSNRIFSLVLSFVMVLGMLPMNTLAASADTTNITGVSITVDGTTYTGGNVTITPTSTVTITVTGTNLQNSTEDNYITYADGLGVPVTSGYFDIAEGGTRATYYGILASDFVYSSNFEIYYSNNNTDDPINRTAVYTGLYVTYDDSSSGETTKTIYFDNSSTNWSNVNAYYWSDSNNTMIAWPGEAMTLVEGETAIYSVEVPAEAEHIVFTDGGTNQTINQTIPTDGKNLYDLNTNEWTTYDDGTSESTVEAKWGADADSLTNAGKLADAIAAAAADSTIRYIRLQSDVSGFFSINTGTFTIDLNGKTITSEEYTIGVRNSGTVVTLTDSASGGAVNSTVSGASAVFVMDGAKLVINGGNYSGDIAVMIDQNGGSVEINGGSYHVKNYAVLGYSDEATVSIRGGSFSGNEASVYTMGVTTVTGGTFGIGAEGAFIYGGGLLDLSGYAGTVTDLKVSYWNWTGADLTVTDENIKLPVGYTFADSEGNAVTTLTRNSVYSVAPEVVKYQVGIGTNITGGTVTADKATAAEGENVTLTVTPDDGNLLFALWVMQGDTLVEVSDTCNFTMPSGDVTITALFEPISYSVTWSDGDGASYLKKFQYGEVITIPTNEVFEDTFRRGGYTLTGWQGYTEGMTMPQNDVIFIAVYTPNQYTVTYKADGAVVATVTVEHGDNVAFPMVPQKDGYVGKWDRNNENITADTVIHAVYTGIDKVVPDEMKTDDKTELEDTKKQLEDMLDDDSYTKDDKKDIQEAIDNIDDALKTIEKVEAVEDKIGALPGNITKKDEAAIKAADEAYNALSDYEKSLVDAEAKKALDDAKAALADRNKPADPNAPATGDNSNIVLWIALLFISGGAVIVLIVVGRKRRKAANKE